MMNGSMELVPRWSSAGRDDRHVAIQGTVSPVSSGAKPPRSQGLTHQSGSSYSTSLLRQ